ncbi:MAG: aspartate--tRNA ligase, partial [Candidatus Colwellbacteria bacterium]|nr:aspartate--tRNA ligase [Candidatus Colwellbacteria bacterium]
VGGGSIRANKPEILRAVFKVMGYEDKKIEKEFGHMLEAFRFGAPPHGGIAHGVERLIMVLAGEEYLREVQAFPQTGSGRTSVMDAPSEVDEKQLKELGIKVIKGK